MEASGNQSPKPPQLPGMTYLETLGDEFVALADKPTVYTMDGDKARRMTDAEIADGSVKPILTESFHEICPEPLKDYYEDLARQKVEGGPDYEVNIDDAREGFYDFWPRLYGEPAPERGEPQS